MCPINSCSKTFKFSNRYFKKMRIGIYCYFYFEILNRHAQISPLNAVIAGSSRYISQGNVRLEFQEVIGYCVTTRFRLFLRIFAYSVTWRIELLFTFLALIHGLICSHERQNQLNVNLTISVYISKRNFFQEILLEMCLKPTKNLISLLLKDELQVRIEIKCFWNNF